MMKGNIAPIRRRKTLESIEQRLLSPFAALSSRAAQTRLFEEAEHPYRTAFQRDRDRIIHSRAFRRLKHKRQVFLVSYGDHYRTRLTHTIEVAQMSRTIARSLGLNEDLVEAVALAHDTGHTPFGHIGEVVLHRIMKWEDTLDDSARFGDGGGFKHNYQSVRIVDWNEKRYSFDGLNLTAPVREGILKHTRLRRGEVDIPGFRYEGLYYELDNATTIEGQIVAVCDEIAQRTHDLEDGLRAGYVTLEQVRSLPMIRYVEAKSRLNFSDDVDRFLYRNKLIRKLVDVLISDVIRQTAVNMRSFYEQTGRTSFFDRRIAWFSPTVDPLQEELDRFIMREIIRVASAERGDEQAAFIIRELFRLYYLYPNLLPEYRLARVLTEHDLQAIYSDRESAMEIRERLQRDPLFARAVCDHIAGMTDDYAENTFKRLQRMNQEELARWTNRQSAGL
ncbi:MAG: dNTP triphosphohydrolase [candidate division KSB1 bacterium]|nr:dNTP triphosphohydrolase [candidate division KSB1 bacterium]